MSCIDRGLLTSSCDTHTKQKQQNKQQIKNTQGKLQLYHTVNMFENTHAYHRCFEYFSCDLYSSTSILLLIRITIFRVNLDESTMYCMWTDTPVKSTCTYSREVDTRPTLKIAGIADKMIHKHDGHAMISMINVLSSKI